MAEISHWPTLRQALKSNNGQQLKDFLKREKRVLPKASNIFRAFELTDPNTVRLVIVGMDPYPNPKAKPDGLAFSANYMTASLKKINEALDKQIGERITNPRLDSWAKQGVLLLNSSLTVRPYKPGSHLDKGWERIIGSIVADLSMYVPPMCFMFWGSQAKLIAGKKKPMQSIGNNLVLYAEHPANAARENRSWRCDHFLQYRKFEETQELKPINFNT